MNKQNSRSQRSSEPSSFEDVLSNTNSKKKDNASVKSNEVNKKKDDKDKVLNSDNNSDKPREIVVKTENKSETKPQAVEKELSAVSNKIIQENVDPKSNENNAEIKLVNQSQEENSYLLESLDLESIQIPKENKMNNILSQKEEDLKSPLSLNLSAVDNKTLVKNENKVIDFENKVAQLIQEQNQISNPELTKVSPMNPQLGKTVKAQEALTKLESPLKEISDENLLSEFDGQLKALSVEGGALEDSQLKDDRADLNSLLSQYTDQESKINSNEPNQFVDELNQMSGENKSEKIENMQSIIKEAKAIIDDGGGSMEIHLQPEGLGKVHLKVAVQNGQVNVEMQTDNVAAKRALEDGLFDIKQALEGQKLLVETLKVEMSPDYQKDFTDMRDHMNEQANRDFAEQFLGQFRQEREERMGGVFDAFKNFERKSEEPNLILNQRNPYVQNGKGRTLNVVA